MHAPLAASRSTDGLLRSAVRAAGLAVLVVALAAVHVPWRPPTFCLLRGTTGIPCPFCGGTTAAVSLGSGDAAAAFRASPLATLGAVALVLSPVVRPRLPRVSRRWLTWGAIAVVGLASELWQLHRFGLL